MIRLTIEDEKTGRASIEMDPRMKTEDLAKLLRSLAKQIKAGNYDVEET